jgi:hypothetical protein
MLLRIFNTIFSYGFFQALVVPFVIENITRFVRKLSKKQAFELFEAMNYIEFIKVKRSAEYIEFSVVRSPFGVLLVRDFRGRVLVSCPQDLFQFILAY